MRVYAIGDIHGRFDLLERLLKLIDDDAVSSQHTVLKIFLGDYIDRGLQSRQVLEKLVHLQHHEKPTPIFLSGNHEMVMHTLLGDTDITLMSDWLRYGGRETLLSYGVTLPVETPPDALHKLQLALGEKVPAAHIAFLNSLKRSATLGDYFFCHAGVRPGVPLDEQTERDLAWIRNEFMHHTGNHGKIIVHGHTICNTAEFKPNRINIDTGAYATGRLTALALEGTKQWLIQTS